VNTIKKYIYIGIGGGIGATLRVLAKAIPFEQIKGLTLYNTLFEPRRLLCTRFFPVTGIGIV